MRAINSRFALIKVALDEATFERFTQEIGTAFVLTFIFGFTIGLVLGGVIVWLITAW